jgi:hypothetical protein
MKEIVCAISIISYKLHFSIKFGVSLSHGPDTDETMNAEVGS